MNQLGAPIGPDIPEDRQLPVYNHVPELWELLPNGGWPGVVYAQVCIHNLKAAADRDERPANLRPIRGSRYYSIEGPRGKADMALVGCGKPIPGAAPEAGARLFFTDWEVERQTGHRVTMPLRLREFPGDSDAEVTRTPRTDERPQESREGHGRVPSGHSPLWDLDGAGRDLAKASPRDRNERVEEAIAVKPKQFLPGHNHPPNFGRIVDGCTGCERVLERRTRHRMQGEAHRRREV